MAKSCHDKLKAMLTRIDFYAHEDLEQSIRSHTVISTASMVGGLLSLMVLPVTAYYVYTGGACMR